MCTETTNMSALRCRSLRRAGRVPLRGANRTASSDRLGDFPVWSVPLPNDRGVLAGHLLATGEGASELDVDLVFERLRMPRRSALRAERHLPDVEELPVGCSTARATA
jgi:hypothetical protein